MSRKEAGELASKRIQETAGKLGAAELPAGTPLFTRTEQPPTGQDPPAGEPVTHGRGRTRKTRTYEKSHPIYAFRIRPEDSARLDALAERLQVTRDALASGLMAAVLDAVDCGRLSLYVDREPMQKRDTLGRLRSHVQTTIRAAWANLAEREKGK